MKRTAAAQRSPRAARARPQRNKPAAAATPAETAADWSVGLRLWIERRGTAVLGEGRADLLAAVDRTHSISAAARALKISYRHAWLMIQAVNEGAGEPLVAAAIGGVKGGGAALTEQGRAALALFRELSGDVRRLAAGALTRIVQTTPQTVTTLHLAAAVSLQEAVGQILTEYALQRPQVRVHALYGASNELAEQIAGGAVVDLFLTGDERHLRIWKAGPGSAKPAVGKIAENGLVGIALTTSSAQPGKPAEVLRRPFRRLVTAEPATPLGNAAQEFLKRRLSQPLPPARIVLVDNSRAVLAALRSGQADLGIAFAGDAVTAADMRILFQVPAGNCRVAYYGAVIPKSHGGEAQAEAALLLNFFQSEIAARCLRRCGLHV